MGEIQRQSLCLVSELHHRQLAIFYHLNEILKEMYGKKDAVHYILSNMFLCAAFDRIS